MCKTLGKEFIMKKKIKIILIVISAFLVITLIAPSVVTVVIYEDNFGKRFQSNESLMYSTDDFDGLNMETVTFTSDKGQKLTGYLYSVENVEYKGVVVMAHGFGGGGHNSYMDSADFFAHNGFYAFGFDVTGNDNSEGDSVGGLTQGVIDLDYAISYIQDLLPDMPVVLFGHSWGAYSASTVLKYHPEVKAVVALSGMNSTADLIEIYGKDIAGDCINLLMPYVNTYEFLKFGTKAQDKATDGFDNSDANVWIIHSKDDTVVPAEYGYDIFYDKYSNNPRFKFTMLEDKGHNYVYCSYEALDYIDSFNSDFLDWAESLDYDYNDSKNTDRFIADKAEYLKTNLDREQWSNLLDTELYEEILVFYNNAII